VIQKEVASIS
jgi:hypothetical protein